jgi:putative redox protein
MAEEVGMPRRAQSVNFEGPSGRLVGKLHRPPGPTEGVAVFAHCFSCGKDVHAARHLADALAHAGFVSLRFDFAGLGQSEGAFADTTLASNVDDLRAAARWMADQGLAPTLLVGHSLGGAAALLAAASLPSVRAVATVGTPSEPSHLGQHVSLSPALAADLASHPLLERMAALRKAVLLLHSPHDTVVGVDHARRLFEAARHPKSFVSLDGADHLLSDPDDARYAGEVVASWARRYASRPDPLVRPVHDDDVETWTGEGFATQVVAHGVHHLRADEPAALGGGDTGPAPFEWVSAGLGACTGMTLRMYADRKQWPLEEVEVHLRHRKEPQPEGRPVDVIERTVELRGPLSDEQRARLLEIADRCPVHRALTAGFVVRTEAAT